MTCSFQSLRIDGLFGGSQVFRDNAKNGITPGMTVHAPARALSIDNTGGGAQFFGAEPLLV
jgi:hypothetical protein